VGFEQFLDGVRFATASETGNVNEGNGAGDGYIKLGIEGEERVSGFVWMKRVDIGHDSVEAVFHVGNKILGSADVCAV